MLFILKLFLIIFIISYIIKIKKILFIYFYVIKIVIYKTINVS
jgi:hypothetical protein